MNTRILKFWPTLHVIYDYRQNLVSNRGYHKWRERAYVMFQLQKMQRIENHKTRDLRLYPELFVDPSSRLIVSNNKEAGVGI